LVYGFLNKFAAKSCNLLPLQLNDVCVKLRMLIAHVIPLSC